MSLEFSMSIPLPDITNGANSAGAGSISVYYPFEFPIDFATSGGDSDYYYYYSRSKKDNRDYDYDEDYAGQASASWQFCSTNCLSGRLTQLYHQIL